mmetsp:Transcript_67847/g.198523  ORF Transcript_67847/g.198523 Transcript_67847/m.198523 type:complete len:273 (+) Transcript_67847:309-1127(+)
MPEEAGPHVRPLRKRVEEAALELGAAHDAILAQQAHEGGKGLPAPRPRHVAALQGGVEEALMPSYRAQAVALRQGDVEVGQRALRPRQCRRQGAVSVDGGWAEGVVLQRRILEMVAAGVEEPKSQRPGCWRQRRANRYSVVEAGRSSRNAAGCSLSELIDAQKSLPRPRALVVIVVARSERPSSSRRNNGPEDVQERTTPSVRIRRVHAPERTSVDDVSCQHDQVRLGACKDGLHHLQTSTRIVGAGVGSGAGGDERHDAALGGRDVELLAA